MSSLDGNGNAQRGKAYWRSLDDLADTPRFRRFVEREFPAFADKMFEPTSRRNFLKVMGASMALAGMTGCRWPSEEILPFTQRPEGYSPGSPMQYATALDLGGSATGLLVTSYDGRPVKVEGNPLHPQSRGVSGPMAQASLLELYDPERSQYVIRSEAGRRTNVEWADFESFAGGKFAALRGDGGAGLRVLTGADSSPSLAAMRSRLASAFPRAGWVEYEPLSRDNERDGTRLLFGAAHRVHPALGEADLIVSFDEDFLQQHPTAVRNAGEWVQGRNAEHGRFSRLVVFESHFSITGAAADQRIPLDASQIPFAAGCLAAELFLGQEVPLPAAASALRPWLERFRSHPDFQHVDTAAAAELAHHRGHGLVLAGPRQAPAVHALVHLINVALENAGKTVHYTADPEPDRPHHFEALRGLADEMKSGRVDTLLILGGNPLYDAPADLAFADLLAAVGTTIHLAAYDNETSRACGWHLPRAHYLETWGDARAHDGTYGVAQPLIEPLFGGRSPIELLALLAGDEATDGHAIVQRTFAALHNGGDVDGAWRRTLHDGLLAGSSWPAGRPSVAAADWAGELESHLDAGGGLELLFLEDPALYDGRFANNGWLQELPDPLTKLCWDNAALVAPATAERLGVGQGEVLRVERDGHGIELPVYIMPGQATNTIGVRLGYGRPAAGRVGDGVGVDAYPLRGTGNMSWIPVTATPTGESRELATTQDHFAIDELGAAETERRVPTLVREVDLEEYRHDPEHAMHAGHAYHPVELWEPHAYEGHRWGLAIDLNACIGCNGCVIACQSENNIPVVGKDEVITGREMHWIRVDRYFSGDPATPKISQQPVACHHCENAPCESVCPVAATVHDGEGLNVMVYNRCIGTRYCSNNCPYKVRRFNYFNNHKNEHAVERMVHNPEVTVRSRGVMEKCTYCVQRINAAKIDAKNARRELKDGEVVTACQQACPTGAIVFGDLNDPDSRVRKMQESPRAYEMLEEINVRARTRYLARVRKGGGGGDHSDHTGNA